MAEAGCPVIYDGVYGTVGNVMDLMWTNSQTAFSTAIQALDDLGSFKLDPINVSTHLNTLSDWWKVQRPKRPEDFDAAWQPNVSLIPEPPAGDAGPDPNFVAPPTFNGTMPVAPLRVAPRPLTAVAPVGPPDLDPVVVPDLPDIELPTVPTLRDIDLPMAPTINLPTFAGVRPDFAISIPQNTFGFSAQNYSSALLDKIRSRISVMLDGKPGLPDAAARQMRDRAFASVDQQGLRAEQEAIEEFAARGFSEPDGVLRRKLAEVRQNNQNQRNSLSRDIYLQDVQIAVEDLRFAVAQGVALEGQLMSNFLATQQLAFDAAKATVQIAIDIANAEIAVANLELSQYQADAQIYRDLIQAELAKIEIYRAQLEGKRLIGELNQQDVAIYSERVRAVLALVEVFNARVGAAKAQADVNVARVQAFGETVRAYGTLVDAKRTEWDAYGKQLEADMMPFRRYELETQIFGNRIDIWGKTNTNLIDQKRLRLSERELDITAYRARLDRVNAAIEAEARRFDALARKYGANADMYRADAAIEQVVSEGNARPFELALRQEQSRVDIELKNAELRINQADKIASLILAAKQAIAQIGSTLSAGLASAMSVHASISSSLGQSTSCSTSFSYTPED